MAYNYAVPEEMTVDGIQIHTGEYEADSRVAIWSHDPSSASPWTEEIGSDFETSFSDGWQGARLDEPQTYFAGETVWVSWHTTPGRTSRATSGTDVTYKWSEIGGTSWRGPFVQAEKFRLLNCGS